jgi:hypothetical protein
MTTITKQIFESMDLDTLIEGLLHQNWEGTEFEKYPKLSTKGKGVFGEAYVEGLMKSRGATVKPPTNPGHDRIIDLKKTEIKFSLASSNNSKKEGKLIDPDSFTFNHIAAEKDWEWFIFLGINPELDNPNIRAPKDMDEWPTHRMCVMNKEDFVSYLDSGQNTVFKKQQGGQNATNDDYMVTGKSGLRRLAALPFVTTVTIS